MNITANMKKVAEAISEYCKQNEYCIGCVFEFEEEDKRGCMLRDTPNNWNFDNKSESEGSGNE